MGVVDEIKNYIKENPGPWIVSMFTMPLGEQKPHEYTAGFMSAVVDDVQFPVEGMVTFEKGGEDERFFAFVTEQIEIGGITNEGAIWFTYHNLIVAPEDFERHPVVFVSPVKNLNGGSEANDG